MEHVSAVAAANVNFHFWNAMKKMVLKAGEAVGNGLNSNERRIEVGGVPGTHDLGRPSALTLRATL